MPSVTSLDQDMRRLRMERYTPSATSEVKAWIEDTLGENLPTGDPLDALKDGVALCKLANLVLPPPGIRYKASSMPFTQRENISHFLAACEKPPLNMPSHDRFLTVDLYDNKDPAQVIQCIGAFSRAANAVNPSRFPTVIGPKRGAASPTRKTADGSSHATSTPLSSDRARGFSNASLGSMSSDSAFTVKPAHGAGRSPATPLRTQESADSKTSSWSRKKDELSTAPAWNIHQYGYMGGASQGNQGISFGGRRQIIGPSVDVPGKTEKDARLQQQELDDERARQARLEEQLAAEKRRQAEIEEEEAQARADEQERRQAEDAEREERRLADEARRAREHEQQQVEEERRRRAEWERRRHDDDEAERARVAAAVPPPQSTGESERIRELERQLAEAKERERQYQLEREQHASSPPPADDERAFLATQHAAAQSRPAVPVSSATRPLASPRLKHPFARPVPGARPASSTSTEPPPGDPSTSTPFSASTSTSASPFASNSASASVPAPAPAPPAATGGARPTAPGGRAGRSLLEREMERERERQREWEEEQVRKMGGARPLGPRAMGSR